MCNFFVIRLVIAKIYSMSYYTMRCKGASETWNDRAGESHVKQRVA